MLSGIYHSLRLYQSQLQYIHCDEVVIRQVQFILPTYYIYTYTILYVAKDLFNPTIETCSLYSLIVFRLEKVPEILFKHRRTCDIVWLSIFQLDCDDARCDQFSRCSSESMLSGCATVAKIATDRAVIYSCIITICCYE